MSSYREYLLDTFGLEYEVPESEATNSEKEIEIIIKEDGTTSLRVGKVQTTSPIVSRW